MIDNQKYLEREIIVLNNNSINSTCESRLPNSSVVLIIGNNPLSIAQKNNVKSALEILKPLAVMAAGSANHDIFAYINDLAETSYFVSRIAIGDTINEYVSEFLWSCWPSEEMFNYWTSYTIILLNEEMRGDVLTAINDLSDSD